MTHSLTLKGSVLKGVIEGPLPSMKNGRRIVTRGARGFGRPVSIKSEDALGFFAKVRDAFWVAVAEQTINAGSVPMKGRLVLTATVYYPSLRSDLDVELLKDSLQAAGLIENDRWIREEHLVAEVDRERPRVEFTVRASQSAER